MFLGTCYLRLGLFLQILLVPSKILFLFYLVPGFLQPVGFLNFGFLIFFSSICCVISSSVFTFVALKVSATYALISSNQGFDSKPLVTMTLRWSGIRCSLISISGYSLVNLSCNFLLYPIFIVPILVII